MAAIFDTTSATTQMSRHMWSQAYRCLTTVIAILNDNKDLVLREATTDILEVSTDANVVTVVGSLFGLLSRLDDELTQSLQIVDPHSEVRAAAAEYSAESRIQVRAPSVLPRTDAY